MNLSDLLKKNEIKKITPDLEQAKECLKASKRDINLAKKTLDDDLDWAFSIAYNAMLQATRALMFVEGYAPMGESHHKIAVDYTKVKFGQKFGDLTSIFEDMRKKRHNAIYWEVGLISEFEAKHAIKTAEKFLEIVKEKIGV